MSAAESLEKLTQEINQMCFQVGQLHIQTEINDSIIKEVTRQATSLAKKADALKSNMPKQGAKDEQQEVSQSNGSNEQSAAVGSAEV